MRVNEITAKHILTKSNLPESGYCINPYVGCLQGCVYCYARFMRRFTGHTEPWGGFLDAKTNAAEVLAGDLCRVKAPAVALIGSVTDAYQPVEAKYKITRGVLTELVAHDFPVSILTKSDLVLRDTDLLKQLTQCTVGFTITTMEEGACTVFEPGAAPTARRLQAMKALHGEGIETYAFVGPVLPFVTDLKAVFDAITGIADSVWAEALNTRCGNRKDVLDAVQRYDPRLVPDFEAALKDKQYWEAIGAELEQLSRSYGIPLVGYYRH